MLLVVVLHDPRSDLDLRKRPGLQNVVLQGLETTLIDRDKVDEPQAWPAWTTTAVFPVER
jgi:hypothetical protein